MLEKVNRQYINNILPDMHGEKFGLSREQAEMEFLKVGSLCVCVCVCVAVS